MCIEVYSNTPALSMDPSMSEGSEYQNYGFRSDEGETAAGGQVGILGHGRAVCLCLSLSFSCYVHLEKKAI